MNWDLGSLWLQPLIAFLSVCFILGLGGLIGWSARRRLEGGTSRARQSERGPMVKAIQDAKARPNQGEAAEDRAYREGERMAPHEWDSGAPRPNLNRQINLGDGWR